MPKNQSLQIKGPGGKVIHTFDPDQTLRRNADVLARSRAAVANAERLLKK